MNELMKKQGLLSPSSRGIALWLLTGVIMIVIQVLLGGITRLTESGLSITEWDPITGILPPMNRVAWQAEFDKYKLTDQFKYVHQNFNLSEFKSIFFWEWFHRVWARLMGIVFLTGFLYFLFKRQFKTEIILPMAILFILGAIQGALGWLMVKSGLVPEKYFVGHVELATHFIAALGLLCYTLWFALRFLVSPDDKVEHRPLHRLLLVILILLFLQLIYGAFMAGLKAAVIAPTWPDINGQIIPPGMQDGAPFSKNLVYNPLTVHFIHRGLAYLLLVLVFIWWIKARALRANRLVGPLRSLLLLLVSLQVVLGILTVLNSTYPGRLVWLGVLHQFIAMLLVMVVVFLLFLVNKRQLYGEPERNAAISVGGWGSVPGQEI